MTLKPPLLLAATVPVEALPSPQLMVAEKSPATAFGSASVKVATVAVVGAPSVALTAAPFAVMCAGRDVRWRQDQVSAARSVALGCKNRPGAWIHEGKRVGDPIAGHRQD